jgi:hypothetical protein
MGEHSFCESDSLVNTEPNAAFCASTSPYIGFPPRRGCFSAVLGVYLRSKRGLLLGELHP